MASKADLYVDQANDPNLILTPMLNDWMIKHNDKFTTEAMDTVWKAMTTPPRDRSASFSASAAGTCLRKQEFGYLGKPRIKPTPQQQEIFTTGTWEHAKWQARLLSANLIEEIEVPLFWPKMLSKGSADGRGFIWWDTTDPKYKGREFILELKTMGSWAWNKTMADGKPKAAHLAQIHRYMLVSGIDLAVYIMIDKANVSNQGWHEMIVEADPKLLDASKKELEELVVAAKNKKLHPIQAECRLKQGDYRYCEYRGKDGVCFSTKEWG